MKKKFLSILLAMCLLLPVLALGEGTVTVNGSATVTLEADSVKVNIGVQTYASDVTQALSDNAAAIEAIKAAVTASGASDISTASFSLDASYDYAGRVPALSGYQVNHMLSVTLPDTDKLGAMLDAAAIAGANEIYSITFCSSQSGTAYEQALTSAVEQARSDAELIAKAAGMQLGSIVSITEGSTGSSVMEIQAKGTEMSTAANTDIMPDGLNFSASVTITYELK